MLLLQVSCITLSFRFHPCAQPSFSSTRKGFGTCSVQLNLMIYNDFDACHEISFSILVVHLRSYFGFDLLSRAYSCRLKKTHTCKYFPDSSWKTTNHVECRVQISLTCSNKANFIHWLLFIMNVQWCFIMFITKMILL